VVPKKRFVERRKHERIPLAVPVFVRGKDSGGKEFLEFATAVNVSIGGALLATRRFLPRFTTVALEVPSSALPRKRVVPRAVRRLRGRLVRVTAVDEYQMWAVKFSSPLEPRSRRGKMHSLR
jgi:PilZ domain